MPTNGYVELPFALAPDVREKLRECAKRSGRSEQSLIDEAMESFREDVERASKA